jgi:hypothetical protein
MIVQRISVRAKPGRRDEVVEVLKAERANLDDPSTMRVLTSNVGAPWNTLVYELTSENLADSEQGWEEWNARPETPEVFEKWLQLVDDWSSEYWNIEE